MPGRRSGFSLVELIFVTALMVMLLSAISATWQVGDAYFNVTDVRTALKQELRKAMDNIIVDYTQVPAGSILNVPADGNWHNAIAFQMTTGVANGYAIWSPNPIRYSLGGQTGSQLVRTDGTDQRILANSIAQFQVRRQPTNDSIIEFSLVARRDPSPPDFNVAIEEEATIKVRLRY